MSAADNTLGELRQQAEECRRCSLSDTRNRVVFGFGDPRAALMFVGEAPGRNEDLRGEPFVGAAGSLFDELLRSIHLDRGDVYITNLIKCRPPGNRNPLPAEIEACSTFLRQQIELVQPGILVTLGNFSTRFILETAESITGLRGAPRRKGSLTVFPVYHPAAAIYDGSKREVLFADFSAIGELLGGVKVHTHSESSTHATGVAAAALLAPGDTLLLSGDLGAGKTALAKGIAAGLGVTEGVTSPTFNIVKVHEGRLTLYHIDLYRLDSSAQLEDVGYFDALDSGGVAVVEWGNRFAESRPDSYVSVDIRIIGDEVRELSLVARGQRGAAIVESWVDACTSLPGVEVRR